jgi:hypothetical protein
VHKALRFGVARIERLPDKDVHVAFEFALACNLRIAEEGESLIGLPEAELVLPPAPGAHKAAPHPRNGGSTQ